MWTLAALLIPATFASANNDDSKGIEFFETRIRPVLAKHCYQCHAEGAEEIQGGLRLDTRAGLRQGGETGPPIASGEPQASLLISALQYEELEMPPGGQLPKVVIADFRRWIEIGAPDPRDGSEPDTGRVGSGEEDSSDTSFWAFQPIRKPEPPAVQDAQGPLAPLDQFIIARWQAESLQPVAEADRPTWLRRVYYDLIGLPPTPEESEAFVNDPSPQADETVVDRLLASPRFGERWGRHWLDVARYAESMGRTRNFPFPFAWRYRDYVIRSFNEDKPYDQFITEQLAGDLLPATDDQQRAELLTATGFLAIGSHDLNQRDSAVYQMDVVGEQIDVVSRAVMGLTVICARCHDHKFDPIPTRDYYALAGIFRSSDLLCGYSSRQGGKNQMAAHLLHALPLQTDGPNAMDRQPQQSPGKRRVAGKQQGPSAEELKERVRQLRRKQRQLAAEPQRDEQQAAELKTLKQQLADAQMQFRRLRKRKQRNRGASRPQGPHAMGVREANAVDDCPINIGGDPHRAGPQVPRGFLSAVAMQNPPQIPSAQSGRVALAEWLLRPDHPLTARVMVNRIWEKLMGRGIVGTIDNFGAMGERPTHPELLDYMAARFIEDDWSVKRAIRRVVLSRTYRLSSDYHAANYEVDPDNRWLWRMNRRRLEAEAIRDSILWVGGSLDMNPPAGSPVARMGLGELGRGRRAPANADATQRAVYLPILRSRVPEMLTVFDFPEPSEVSGRRNVTTVATQALFLMNNPLVITQSRLAADRLVAAVIDDRERVDLAYRQVLSRRPSDEEAQRVLQYVRDMLAAGSKTGALAQQEAWARVYHSLLASSEFRYRG